jgi:virginiamycin B lyase
LKRILKKKQTTLETILLVALVSVLISIGSTRSSHVSVAGQSKYPKLVDALSSYSDISSTFSPSSTPIQEFQLPLNNSYPLGLVTDSQGNVFFGEAGTDNIEEFIPTNQTFRSFHIPISSQLAWIWTPVFDSSGDLWFTTTNGSDIWRLDPTSGQFTPFSTGNPNVQPYALAYENSSNQIWFTSFLSNQFGAFQLSGSDSASPVKLYNLTVTQGSVSGSIGAGAIALDNSGNVYVSESFAAKIAKFSQSNGQLEKDWTLPRGSNPLGIVVDPRTGFIWFTNHATDFFGYVNQTSNIITQFSTSPFLFNGNPEVTLPYWIYLSSSGVIWFNEHIGDRIARFDPNTTTLTEFNVPTPQSEPIKLTLDNQRGLVWFSEFTGNKIGMLEQNQSLSSQISLSNSSLILTGSSAKVEVTVSSGNLLPLNVSSTASTLGVVEPNFTISTQKISSSQLSLQIARGDQLSPGSYYLTFCSNQALAVRSCALASILVEPSQPNYYVDIFIAVAVIVVAVAISIYFVRKWKSRVS